MRYFPCFYIILCICSILLATTFVNNALAQESDKPDQNMEKPDTKQAAKLTIKATPWATVSIDNKIVGTTPVQRKVSPGEHVVQVRLPPQKKQYTTNITIENHKAIELFYDFNSNELTQKELIYDPSIEDQTETQTNSSNESKHNKSKKHKKSPPKITGETDAKDRPLNSRVDLPF